MRSIATKLACFSVIVALALGLLAPLLSCNDPCIIDFGALFGPGRDFGVLDATDTRLNAWILWWVQTALLTDPATLFDANVFWPATGALVGSEHMLTLAVLTLPMRLFTDDALLVYHAAMLLTFVVAGLSTFAFVSWLTGDALAAIVAALAAMSMPWRMEELVHLQLLAAGFIPLVWMLTVCALRERAPFGVSVMLTLAWALQLFSSYYLAYFAIFTTAAFLAVYALAERVSVRVLARAVVPFLLAAGALAVVSLPYWTEHGAGEVVLRGGAPLRSLAPAWILAKLAPSIASSVAIGGATSPWTRGYELPASVLALALLGAWQSLSTRRSVVLGILAAIGVALVMSFGDALVVAGASVSLPAAWASALVPGFANLRAPLRWTLVIGVAVPLLAGLGLARLRETLRRRARDASVALVTVAVVALLAVDLRPPHLVTAPVYAGLAAELPALRKLGAFDDGALLDIPWPENLSANAVAASEYMVASTVHKKPILAGYTAYFPRHHDFLLHASRRLPDPAVVRNLARATGLRWIVLHHAMLAPGEREKWEHAAFSIPLITALRDDALTVYELPGSQLDPLVRDRLLAATGSPLTLNGLSRAPLALAATSGDFAATVPAALPLYDKDWTKAAVGVSVTNRTASAWASLDPHRAGLVLVRYRFRDAAGRTIVEGLADLDDDISPGATLDTYIIVEGHVGAGRHELVLDLVQQLAAGPVALPLAPVSAWVSVGG